MYIEKASDFSPINSKQRIASPPPPPALGVWVESTHFTPQYSPLSHAIFKQCHLSSFVPICISVMCTCAEPHAWTGSQTSPFEIIPVLGRSCVFGHSLRDRLTLLTEFRWARRLKSLHLSRQSLQCEQENWLSSYLPGFLKQLQYTVKGDNTGFYREIDDQFHLREWKLKGL